jgi:hypothetical protein
LPTFLFKFRGKPDNVISHSLTFFIIHCDTPKVQSNWHHYDHHP